MSIKHIFDVYRYHYSRNLKNLISPTATLGPLIAGRATLHVHCEDFDLWVDCETGLVLKSVEPNMTKEVTSIEYNPVFPKGIFEFVPPPSARELK